MILEGKPEGDDLYKIVITKDGIKVIVDNRLKLMDNYPLMAKLRQEYGDKVAYMSIGFATAAIDSTGMCLFIAFAILEELMRQLPALPLQTLEGTGPFFLIVCFRE